MAEQSIKEQLQENKKKLVVLGAVMLFGVYMMWPSGGEVVEESGGELDAQLAALQIERENSGAGGSRPTFEGTDPRGISVSGGGEGAPGVFQTGSPLVVGVLVGFGTKTDTQGEYLVAYVNVQDTSGYEIDMRDIVGYNTTIPPYLSADQPVRVYGEFTGETRIRADAVQ